ncbi:small ribosomal subunit protein mS31 [Pempheris klunzingeri]|uniref:small ribosomal subunit protein mS31 n=1 Tax=Pempheris klunzingeri TaxID=3127111 RepID=UPI00397ED7BF
MHRFLFRTGYTALNSSVSVYESCVSAAKAAAPVFRVANGGVKAFSTSSVRLCEKKNDVAPSNQDEEASAGKETETPSLVTLKVTDDSEVIKTAEQSEEPVVLQADGSSTQQEMDVKSEQVAATPTQVQTDAAVKSGKEGLLELLGTMKVDVVNKRKFRNLGVKQHYGYMGKNVRKAAAEASSASETLDPELVAAAYAAASTLPNSSQAESELLKKLRQHEAVTEVQKKDANNIEEIIADMKISKNPKASDVSLSHPIQFDEEGQRRGITAELPSVQRRNNLFSGKRLNIFSPAADEDGVESSAAQPTLWDMDFAYQLSQMADQMPCNGLEEVIQWTKEGKMWQYPINNEAGLEEEAGVLFYEHVFLEKHLAEGFPRQGPVRHFMELVVAGLSRNPYLTVHQKREHISWFRDYFCQKEGVLKEAGVHLK